jgi:hypothetical protein
MFDDGVAVDLQPPKVMVAPDDDLVGFQDRRQVGQGDVGPGEEDGRLVFASVDVLDRPLPAVP